MEPTSQRDYYLDSVKGLLILSIVFIHTVFWSGEIYAPPYMRNIALALDIPLFFFITGCVISIHANFDPWKQMRRLALIFFGVVLLCQAFFSNFNLSELLCPFFYNKVTAPKFVAIAGSYWFVPVYVTSLIYAKLILDHFKPWVEYSVMLAIPIFYCVSWFSSQKISLVQIFGLDAHMVLFYIWLILAGHKAYSVKDKKLWLLFSVVALSLISLLLYSIPDLYFQNYKFPVQLPYIILSLFSISATMLLYKNINDNILAKIGKNSLCYYLSQGIGTSLIYSLAELPIKSWILKLLLCFSSNLIITITLGYFLSLLYPKFEKLFAK